MNKPPRNRIILGIVSLIAVLVVVAGFIVPLGAYAATPSCSDGIAPGQVRLHAIAGQSLKQKRASHEALERNPVAGCSAPVVYTLYLL